MGNNKLTGVQFDDVRDQYVSFVISKMDADQLEQVASEAVQGSVDDMGEAEFMEFLAAVGQDVALDSFGKPHLVVRREE